MDIINISTKPVGLKKSDVDMYISGLIKSHKQKLNNLLQEKKLLERTRYKLLSEIRALETTETIYEEVYQDSAEEPLVMDTEVEKTIALINELAEQKIRNMVEKASKQIAEYDNILETLQREIDANKEKTEQLLSEVVNFLKANIDDVFPQKHKSGEDRAPVRTERKNIINLSDKKPAEGQKSLTIVPKDIETKIISSLKSYNIIRSDFLGYINNILNSKKTAKGAVLLLEINNLLIVNYFTRPSREDALMSEVTERINKLEYNLYTVRLSYDQIGIVYDGVNEIRAVSELAQAILEQVQSCAVTDGGTKTELSANIGISLYPQNAMDAKTIMNCAGIALYKSKEKGKGYYEFINEELIREIKLTNDFKHDLAEAIRNDELELYYQPQFSAADDTLIGFEALLRWRNEKYDKVPILHIIQTAEKEDLISDIGCLIFRKACLFAKRIKEKSGRKIIVSVNFSNAQIEKKEFVETVKRIIDETGADPECIGLEVTESCFSDCFSDNCAKIQQIKDMGVTILIDDFGTGYSMLSYLLRLPVSIVKIDRTFLEEITTSERSANFISSIINITHDLGLKVIAEGIESEGQRVMLKAMGCDYFQGYFLSRPVNEESAYAYV